MKTLARKLAPAAAIAALILVPSTAAFAKGGETNNTVVTLAPTTTTTPVSSTGICDTNWSATTNGYWYPLSNGRFPGNVAVDVSTNTAVPKANAVCVSPGWSYESKAVTDGIDIRFFYQGERAIDFKYVLGKTDIRNY